MPYGEDIVNTILRTVERSTAGRHNKRAGLVTSWDAKNHLAKVLFQPEGHETGWLPTHTMAAGNGYGHMTGLTPGDGKTTGDQVEVVYQEGDFDTGAIVARLHSDVDKPPAVQAGEQLFMSPFSSSIKLAMDGSIVVTDKAGSTIVLDGTGGITMTAKPGSVIKQDSSGNISLKPGSGKNVYLGGDGTSGTFLPVLCVGDVPSINVLARTA